MDDSQHTIGLTALLDEVGHDLDELRRKHANDFGVKNITMWWELESERLIARHGTTCKVTRWRRPHGLTRLIVGLLTGWLTMLVLMAAVRLLAR